MTGGRGPFIRIGNERELEAFAIEFAKTLKGGQSIGLSGELGAGKTTLTRYIVTALGIDTPVSSPTYVLQHEYGAEKPPKEGRITVEHWDLYRLREAPPELDEPAGPDTIRLIEWPEKAEGLSERLDILLKLSIEDAEARTIEVSVRENRSTYQ